MFEFLKDAFNYEERKVSRNTLENKLEISTCYTSDEGYETAIIDANSIHPVERYANKEEAMSGHIKWMAIANKSPEIIEQLGGFGGIIKPEKVKLNYDFR